MSVSGLFKRLSLRVGDCLVSWRRLMTIALLVTFCAVLQGCYLPEAFKVDLSITRNGDYHFVYRGHLVQPSLAKDLIDQKIDADQEKERVATITRDLTRDTATRSVAYLGRGVFDVTYDYRGNIMRDKSFVFVRRNSRILEILYHRKSNTVEIRGGAIPPQYRERLSAIGYQLQGEIEVLTDAGIRSSNAQARDKVSGMHRLRWQMKSLDDPAPQLTIG